MAFTSKFRLSTETLQRVLLVIRDFPQPHLVAASLIVMCTLSLTFLSVGKNNEKRQIVESIELQFAPLVVPEIQVLKNRRPLSTNSSVRWHSINVRVGDNLSTLFDREGIPTNEIYNLTASPGGNILGNLYPGEKFRIGVNNKNQIVELEYIKSPLMRYIYAYKEGSYQTEKRERKAEVLLGFRKGVIIDSLYNSAKKVQLPDNIIMEMANIFGWDIDFVFDIREGDKFSLLFEERYLDGEKLDAGDIIAASFTNRGKTYRAIRYQHSDGSTLYYSPEGLSMRKTFLRTPLDIFRITSGFNLKRKHPIHKKIKAHRGVDYAAPRGTPVYAVGKGKVSVSGFSKANGNYVFLQHGQTYMTKYLHLHERKVKTGQTVSQRMLIGTVGSTGYSTGPHLHYEFLVNGVHKNPRTVELPKADPINAEERERFELTTKPLLVRLAIYEQASQYAVADPLDAADAN